MAAWFAPLLALLADQPPDTATVMLTLGELEALTSGPLPAAAATQTYWYAGASAPSQRLATIGWSCSDAPGSRRGDHARMGVWLLLGGLTLTSAGGEPCVTPSAVRGLPHIDGAMLLLRAHLCNAAHPHGIYGVIS